MARAVASSTSPPMASTSRVSFSRSRCRCFKDALLRLYPNRPVT